MVSSAAVDLRQSEAPGVSVGGHQAVVCFPFIGDLVGGSHMSSLGLIRNLPRDRFVPLVVLHHTDGPVAELFRREGIGFVEAPVLNRLERAAPRNGAAVVNVVRTVPGLVKFLRARNASIVHTNDGRTHLIWGLAARIAGSKHLWHHRGDATSFGLRHVAPWLPNRLVAVSKFASPRPGFFSAAGKCSVVHSPFDVMKMDGFDRVEARNNVLAAIGCSPDTKLLGYVGTLVARKRPILFVEAIAALKRLSPETKVAGLFFGDALNGLDEAARSRAEALGVADCIHFMGFRYPGEAWIAGLDALLVTAVNEPLGRTLVEAMLLRTPVIAADSGGNPEVVEDGRTGMLVPADDPDEFAKACLALFNNSGLCDHLVETARGEVRSRFSFERHVHAITSVYENLIGGTGMRRSASAGP
ncbi:glycosyltransferase family 4 protein [Sinorhizobium medicae]|uniref:Glycosyl transferase group 1 n=1 Tax=Sinorhizobium medicae (strain WSM419) TaxID=366394 RepID=A6UI95_SINMW|nr:glycosyltransferase family 4 protein [Sinorhizobium medicae]ABR63375.1 glycosyl transferase group 1 [Sinorhizobium medicae WSM419]MDX0434358.1 glycosyltransferase [Sinorhizobium medicae]MDX0612056.1 glycosyltransferase [Sinorhizobium medicae]MDX0652100.1 glycosyltransferase [Sinorhizobium medicae]MDX0677484.1 glycosyltransferase [Sinorhizobium medicae]